MFGISKGYALKVLFGTVFVLNICVASAQRPITSNQNRNQYGTLPGLNNQNQNQMQYGSIGGVQDNDAPEEEADTTKKPPKIRKPLESYFFNDSIRARQSFAWNVNLERNDIDIIDVDTALVGFQNEYPYLQNNVGSAYLGNLGAASVPLDYFLRPQYRNFSFAQSFDAYLFTPQRVRYFNVKKPFTHLSYFMSGQTRRLEESFWGAHAQNVSPSTGFNVDYRSRGTRGIYTWQGTRERNLSLAFSHTGKKYSVHAGYIYNMQNVKENGGIMRDEDITDTVFEMPEMIEVRLQDARNQLKNNTFYIVQSYGVPLRKLTDEDFSIAQNSSFFIGHSLELSKFYKKYTDTKAKSGDFYENWYISPTQSVDSMYERVLSNRIFVQIQPWDRDGPVGVINAGIGNDAHHYYQFSMEDYLTNRNKGVNKNGTFVYGSVEGKFRKYFSWDANIKYHLFGYRSQDLELGGDVAFSVYIAGKPITLKGSIGHTISTPDYWTENYFSNHYAWNNSFAKESETRISATLSVPSVGLELGAYQSLLKDRIYYDAQALPAQHGGNVSVSGLYARKDFRIGGLHLNHRVLLQFSTVQEVVPVPLASAYLSYFYEFNVVKNVLRLQIGLDGRYNTEYYAFGYNPATAQFYNQREKKLGNYPMIDVFVAAKWKRMRILAKMQHLNDNLFGDRNYFTVLHYPQNKRVFKMGFSWSFYD